METAEKSLEVAVIGLEAIRPDAMRPDAMGIEDLLRETVEALSRLDAGRLESLAEAAGRIPSAGGALPAGWPETAAEWRRAAASHWVLGHLVGATARQLAVQRRISERALDRALERISERVLASGEAFRVYRPGGGDAALAARMNAVLAWPGSGPRRARPAV